MVYAFWGFVRHPITLDNEFSLIAVKVADIVTKLMLAPELRVAELPIP